MSDLLQLVPSHLWFFFDKFCQVDDFFSIFMGVLGSHARPHGVRNNRLRGRKGGICRQYAVWWPLVVPPERNTCKATVFRIRL